MGLGLASAYFSIAKAKLDSAKTYSHIPSACFSIGKAKYRIAKAYSDSEGLLSIANPILAWKSQIFQQPQKSWTLKRTPTRTH